MTRLPDVNPRQRQYLGTIENLALIIYRIVPSRVRHRKEWALEYYEVPPPVKLLSKHGLREDSRMGSR